MRFLGRRGGILTLSDGKLTAETAWCRAACGFHFPEGEEARLRAAVDELARTQPGGVLWESHDGRLTLMMATGKRGDVQVTATVVGGEDHIDRLEMVLDLDAEEFYRSMGSPTALPHSVHEPS